MPPAKPGRSTRASTRVARPSASNQTPDRSVLFIGSEALPFAKTGGLADVLGALPGALGRLGWDVTVALPRYRGVTAGAQVDRFTLSVGGYTSEVGFFSAPLGDRTRALLVDDPALFDREYLYGVGNADYPDNPRRFAVLVRAALEFAARQGKKPSVVHAHDWQAGLAAVYLRTLYASHPVLTATPVVFTIHNLAYQGLFGVDWLPRLDLPWTLLGVEQMEYWGWISFLKGGINAADVITTVSPQYALEIQTPAGGAGFDGILRRRAADLVGILNGIDAAHWDPARDPNLPRPFTAKDLSGKRAAKARLLEIYGMTRDDQAMARPLVGMISRMVDQKGFDLIAALASELPRFDAGFVVLGTGEPRYQDLWRGLAARYPDRIGARIGFDEGLAHLIEAGADIFLMPSQFEPCGLNQMYSLRYGTVPIVRRVGGLADTVVDAGRPGGDSGQPAGPQPNGFVFDEYSAAALRGALERALATFKDERTWRALQLAGMAQDHSWDRSAREYVKIYERAMAQRAAG
jgi:starch synthase